ncbi:MAG: hypothetical protein WA001_00820 [Patescibacteria group bacterium]
MERQRFSWPSWLWKWHHLLSIFILFFGIGMAVASLQVFPSRIPLQADSSENIVGWVWADPVGWISANDLNPSSCSPGPCGSYGINLDTTTNQINGFAWNDDVGWICFGTSCSASGACNGTPPAGALTASINPGAGTVQARGWAKVCNEGDDGWISLNCLDAPGSACAAVSPYWKVVFNHSTGAFKDTLVSGSSFAWNGTAGGTGFGYMDFQQLHVSAEAPPFCNDNKDNDGNGLKDCQEAACSTDPSCLVEKTSNGNCADGIDNDGSGIKDCQEAACSTDPHCLPEIPANGNCADGFDNDGDNLIDCADPGCTGYPACVLSGEAACPLGSANACCSDGTDNDGTGGIDCADTNCQNQAPICTPAFLSAKFGDVYAQNGISGQTTAGGQSVSNATYCLTSQGSISGFSSSSTCVESNNGQNITLPTNASGYASTLGSIDVNGIIAGHYGPVTTYLGTLPPVLNGQVFVANGNATLGATTFQNGSGATQRGNGLLIVNGGDLTITNDLAYQTNALSPSGSLKNLASFGVIVTRNSSGVGGNIIINPSVKNLVGAYFAERVISTGSLCAPAAPTCPGEQPLQILGLMAAFEFKLQRNTHDPNIAAETVIFDGRAVANPPPGMQQVSQSLPSSKDAF